jgi:ATP-binding cassette subfamily B protein/subfamily B ATP-binding cassette protein MsbA
MNLYRRVIFYYRPFLGPIIVAMLVLLLTIALNLLKPWPLQYIIDHIIPQAMGQPMQETYSWVPADLPWLSALFYSVVFFVLIHLLNGIFSMINNYWLVEIGLKALLRLRTEVYSYLQSLPLRFHDARRSGDSSFRVAYDTQAIQTFFNRGFATIISSGITLIGTFCVMFSMNVFLSLLSLCVVPFLLGAIFFFAERIRSQSITVQQEESDVLSKVSEGLSSIRVVHAFGREDYEVKAFTKEASDSLEANRKLTLTNVSSSLVVGLITALGTALLMYYGVLEVQAGHLKLGELTVFIAYLVMLYQPLEQLSYTVWAMEGAAAGAGRVFEILDTENDVKDKPHAKPFRSGLGKMELRDVRFGYSPDQPILKGINFTIKSGKTVALVGGTGAGKTTILSLIPRFYDPSSGQVLIDDQDIRDVQKDSLRKHMSMVLQDTALIPGTIEENIAYGKPGASHAEIAAAAQAAQAAEFIQALPLGYSTEVGERGIRLSGGQRQRIGIARAFLRNSPILLLDEPTSALDLKTEAELMGTLKNLMQKPTTLIITHRLSTIHHADCIHVLEHGQIVESGTGPELLAKGGLYASLWNAPHVEA